MVSATRMKDRTTRLLLRWLVWSAVIASLAIIFARLAEDVWFQEEFAWDAPLMLAIHQGSRPWLDTVVRTITLTGGALAVVIALGLAAWLWRGQRSRPHGRLDAVTVLIAFGGAACINAALKLLFARPRPAVFPPLVHENSYSFPSGHAVAAVALYGLLAVLLWRRGRYGWAFVSGAWVVVVALSRVYLGVHYPSDVLASLAYGTLWLIAVLSVRDWYERRAQQVQAAPESMAVDGP